MKLWRAPVVLGPRTVAMPLACSNTVVLKASGYGCFGGRAAIADFTDLRWITIEDPKQHYPFRLNDQDRKAGFPAFRPVVVKFLALASLKIYDAGITWKPAHD